MKLLRLLTVAACATTWLMGIPAAQAQSVLLRGNVAADTLRSDTGPNRTFFSHFYLGYAAVVGKFDGPGAELRYGRSGEMFVGMRQKYRLSQTAAVGLDLRYARLVYHLAQNDQKFLPTPDQHQRETIALPQAQAEVYGRLNIGRRGNVVGRYLDLTGWGGWIISSAHHYVDKPGPNGAGLIEVTERKLNYINRWSYGVGARLGSGRYAVVTRYRLADSFKDLADAPRYPEFPRLVIGLELGLF
ncbi:hypothetical protein H8B13_14195 [Hymenobacter sp. BT188]|uniref:hypothetical protein n=1 Tax=Hymenobacter sp. BT188 TaxID=2763504 RepID=UPI0016514DA9|nr:hypothetical protein [Hymenobacter sp. BT188]MBC6607973.1 hypothetical protein [Hymenobacter sp. BT188]